MPRTLVLMSDNRPPVATDLHKAPYHTLAAVINFNYCLKHNYDFRYVLLNNCSTDENSAETAQNVEWKPGKTIPGKTLYFLDILFTYLQSIVPPKGKQFIKRQYLRFRRRIVSLTNYHDANLREESKHNHICNHHELGPRAAPWGKLLSIHKAMQEEYDRIIYIDSDAILNRIDMTIEDFLLSSTVTSESLNQKSLFLTYNWPWIKVPANTGFMIWNNTARASELIERWWNTDTGKYHLEHSFEQHTMNHLFLSEDSKNEIRDDVEVIPSITFQEMRRQFVRHIASDQKWLRIPRFRHALARLNIKQEQYDSLIARVAQDCQTTLDTSIDTINTET